MVVSQHRDLIKTPRALQSLLEGPPKRIPILGKAPILGFMGIMWSMSTRFSLGLRN